MTAESAPQRVRVVAVTQSDPFFTGAFFQTFLQAAPAAGVELVEIVLLRNFNESRLALLRRFERLYGPKDTARLLARYAHALVDDRRGRPRSVEAIASRHDIPLRRLETINDGAYLATLRPRGVDVLLSVAAPEIFKEEALSAAPRALNVHSGRLPQYRGMMPTFWALHDNAEQVVVTVHEMAERIDAGGILAEFEVPIGPGDSAFDVARNAKLVAGRRVAELLSGFGTDSWPAARAVEAAEGRYRSFPQRSDAQRVRALGRRLL